MKLQAKYFTFFKRKHFSYLQIFLKYKSFDENSQAGIFYKSLIDIKAANNLVNYCSNQFTVEVQLHLKQIYSFWKYSFGA